MAERKVGRRQWETNLIVGNRLMNRLMRHIMADPDAPPPEPPPEPEPGKKPKKPAKSPLMTDTQVKAALGLLKKYMPDLKAIEISGNPDHPLVTEVRRVIVDPAHTADSPSIPAAADPE